MHTARRNLQGIRGTEGNGGWLPSLRVSIQVIAVVMALALPSPSHAADLDGDGDVDQDDLNMLLRDRGKTVSQSTCGAPCDLDNDGKITALDARRLSLLCTWKGCALEGIRADSPEDIQAFLDNNPAINTAAKFLENLPQEFKRHWIMMSHSESLQTGTATSPRLLLPSGDSRQVFGFALRAHPSFPLADPETIEYLQFEDSTNKFRFHSIKMSSRKVVKDDALCQGCHFGRPNWDAYDSWAGMLPFSRDRIYENSEEEKAVKRLLKDLRDDSIVKQLEIPKGITRDANGDITIMFDRKDLGASTNPVSVSYFEPNVLVTQGGSYLRLHHSVKGDMTDEGRGVALFDNFTRDNARRVAQELLDHPRNPVDIRPIALAIANNCVNANNLGDFAPQEVLDEFIEYHGKSFPDLLQDTDQQRKSLPKQKADLQRENLEDLIKGNGGDPSLANITKEIFRRSSENMFALDVHTKFMIDREIYEVDNTTIALFRFFLEPLNVQVGQWSLSVLARSQTYTFGDLFSKYTAEIIRRLEESLQNEGQQVGCPELAVASKKSFEDGMPPLPPPPPGIDLVLDGGAPCDKNGLFLEIENRGSDASGDFEVTIFYNLKVECLQNSNCNITGQVCIDGTCGACSDSSQCESGEECSEGRCQLMPPFFGTNVVATLLPPLPSVTVMIPSIPGEGVAKRTLSVPDECFDLPDIPLEKLGCNVGIILDSRNAVPETDEANNTINTVCGP